MNEEIEEMIENKVEEKFDQKVSEAQKNGKIKDEENRSKDSQVSRRGFLKK